MSVPQPPNALEGHCAAIQNGTLYVLSPSGLQSLPLKQNAAWTQHAGGVSVTDPSCVTATVNGEPALFVVGGTASDSNFSGLQRFWFGTQSWETLPLPANNIQDRTNHSVAYLNDSQALLVYAGSQPQTPSFLSSQTFVISVVPPYNIQSFTSNAPPVNLPILEPWNSSHAIMVGGADTNTEVFLFSTDGGWQPWGTNLSQPLSASSRGLIVDGSDGSKVLEVINAGSTPNTVSQIVLLDANGQTAKTGQTPGGPNSRKRKRDLSLSNWPTYNATGAPTTTRTDFALAQDPSGLVVLVGGDMNAPLALFNQSENSWVDANTFFDSTQQPLQASSTSTPSASRTPTSSSKSTASSAAAATAAPGGLSPHEQTLRVLGITLGVLFGIAALFVLILLYLRWRKGQAKSREGYIEEKPGARMSFVDRGASFMKEAGGSRTSLTPPDKHFSVGASRSSFAIVAGKVPKKNHLSFGRPKAKKDRQQSTFNPHSSFAIIAGKIKKSNPLSTQQPRGSFESTTALVNNKNGLNISEPMEMVDYGDKHLAVPSRRPVPRNEQFAPSPRMDYDTEKELAVDGDNRGRSSGWSKYFATSGPTGPNGISHLPAAYIQPHMKSDASAISALSDMPSEYSHRASQPSHIPSSVLVPPLDIDFNRNGSGHRLSHVTTGSPSFSDSREDLRQRGSPMDATEGQSGLIVDSRSLDRRSQISGYSLSSNRRTTMGSTLSNAFDGPQTPTSFNFKDHLNSHSVSPNHSGDAAERPSSSDGASTISRPTSSGNRPTTAGAADTRAPSSVYTMSGYDTRVPSRGKNGGGFFPGSGTSYRAPSKPPKLSSSPALPTPSNNWGPPLPPTPTISISTVDDRERASQITVFPRGVPSTAYPKAGGAGAEQKVGTSDMSWLNLGFGGGSNRV